MQKERQEQEKHCRALMTEAELLKMANQKHKTLRSAKQIESSEMRLEQRRFEKISRMV
jgi:hypothetical protein